MPGWLVSIIINLVLKFGLPYVLTWLHEKFPWLPVSPSFIEVLKELLEKLRQHKADKQASVTEAKQKLRRCIGPSCAVPQREGTI